MDWYVLSNERNAAFSIFSGVHFTTVVRDIIIDRSSINSSFTKSDYFKCKIKSIQVT